MVSLTGGPTKHYTGMTSLTPNERYDCQLGYTTYTFLIHRHLPIKWQRV